MITVNIRKQGGAAIITIPADVLKLMNIEVGTALKLDVNGGVLQARPVRTTAPVRYTLAELLRGTSAEGMAELVAETEWARDGEPVGRELG